MAQLNVPKKERITQNKKSKEHSQNFSRILCRNQQADFKIHKERQMKHDSQNNFEKNRRGAWLAQSEDHATLVGCRDYLNK